MRKMLLKLIVVFILVCNLTANAEGNMHSLRISYFPAELCGRSDSFVPSETAQNELLALIDAIEFRNMTDYDGAWPDRAAPICEITLEYNGYTAFLRGDGWIRVNDASIGIWLLFPVPLPPIMQFNASEKVRQNPPSLSFPCKNPSSKFSIYNPRI